jgi:hypothetical protein
MNTMQVRILIDFQEWHQGDIVCMSERDAKQLMAVGMAEGVDL